MISAEGHDDMPRSSDSQNIDDAGEAILTSAVTSLGWKLNPHRKDFGFDGNISVFENQKHTGVEFLFQLKSKVKLRKTRKGLISCPGFKGSTVNLFKKSNGNPVIIVVETSTGNVFWDFAASAAGRRDQKNECKTSKQISLQIASNRFDVAGVRTLVDTLQRINREIPRPIQHLGTPSFQLARLDSTAQSPDIQLELQDAVDFSNANHFNRALEKGLPLLDRTANENDKIRVIKLLGKCYFELGEDELAIEFTRRGLQSQDPGIANNLISLLSRMRRFEDVSHVIAALTAELKRHPLVLAAIGFSKLIEGRPGEALLSLTQAIHGDPEMLAAKVNRAFILRDYGEYSDAKAELKEVFEKYPTHDEARAAYANILLAEYELTADRAFLDEARKFYSNIVDRFRKSAPGDFAGKDTFGTALVGLAALESRAGEMRRCQELLKETLDRGYHWRTVYYNLAQCEMAFEKPFEARANYLRALRVDDEEYRAAQATPGRLWHGLASCFMAIYDSFPPSERPPRFLRKARWAYLNSQKLDPGSIAYRNLGIVLIRMGRIDDAEILAAKYANKKGGHYLLAMCYKSRQKWPEMVGELEAELVDDPKDFTLNAELGDYYFNTGNYVEAQRFYETALSLPGWYLHSFASELGAKLAICFAKSKGVQPALDFLLAQPQFLQDTPLFKKAYSSIVKKEHDSTIKLWLQKK